MLEKLLGMLAGRLIPDRFLFEGRFAGWYNANPYHRFNVGDFLIVKERGILRYGIRPVAIVEGFSVTEYDFGKVGEYKVTLTRDLVGDKYQWMTHNEVYQGVRRTSFSGEVIPKFDAENYFKKARVKSVEDAVALYKTHEVPRVISRTLMYKLNQIEVGSLPPRRYRRGH